jgi:glycosyltransferase 2 family protein
MRKTLMILAAAGFTVLALWLSFRGVDWQAFSKALAGADYGLVAAAAAIALFAVYALGWRWSILLAPRIRPRMAMLFRWNILAQFANIVLPARANEFVRAWLTNSEGGTEMGFALGTIAVERVFDVGVFAAALIAGPWIFGLGHGFVPPAVLYVMASLSVSALVVLVFWPQAALGAAKAASRLLPARFRARVNAFVGHAADAFAPLRSPKTAALITAHTVLLLLLPLLAMWVSFKAFGLDVPVGAGLFVFFVRMVGNLPPAAPGRIGLYEVTLIYALAAYGVPRSQSLGLALVLHVVTYGPKIALGLFYLAKRPVPLFKAAPGGPAARP